MEERPAEYATIKTDAFPHLFPRGTRVRVVGRGFLNANSVPCVYVPINPGEPAGPVLALYMEEVELDALHPEGSEYTP